MKPISMTPRNFQEYLTTHELVKAVYHCADNSWNCRNIDLNFTADTLYYDPFVSPSITFYRNNGSGRLSSVLQCRLWGVKLVTLEYVGESDDTEELKMIVYCGNMFNENNNTRHELQVWMKRGNSYAKMEAIRARAEAEVNAILNGSAYMKELLKNDN